MKIHPLPFEKADEEVKNNYLQIISALNLTNLPIFFQYFGNFPEYLNYITKQIVANLQNEKFNFLVKESASQLKKLIKESFIKTDEIKSWLQRYRYTPQFYNFQNSLQEIFLINFKLTLIFLALRESIKGWAIAAKKIPATANQSLNKDDYTKQEKRVVFKETESEILNILTSKKNSLSFSGKNTFLEKNNQNSLEINFFIDYLKLCKGEFFLLGRQEKYFLFRVQVEKFIINSLSLMPELIFSPINVVLPLISRFDNYPDFLYLLTEHFPQLIIQKLLFSGYLLIE